MKCWLFNFKLFYLGVLMIVFLMPVSSQVNTYQITSTSISPDGTLLAIGGGDDRCNPNAPENYVITILDIQTQASVATLQGPYCQVLGLAWDPAGTRLINNAGGTIMLWDTSNWTFIASNDIFFVGIQAISWDPHNSQIAVSSDVGSLHIVDANTLNTTSMINVVTSVIDVAWNPILPNILATGDIDGAVRIWDTSAGSLISTFDLSLASINTLAWHPDGMQILGGLHSGEMKLINTNTGETRDIFQFSSPVMDVTWSANGRYYAAGTIGGQVNVWHLPTNMLVNSINSTYGITTVSLVDDGGKIFYGGRVPVGQQAILENQPVNRVVEIISLEIIIDGNNVQSIIDGDTIDLAMLGTSNLAIRANTNPATIGSVVFNLNGTVQSDDAAPYDLTNWLPTPGQYTLTATSYSGAGGTGTAGIPLTVNFTVIESITCTTTIPAADTPALLSAISSANTTPEADTICLDGTYTLTAANNSGLDGANGLPVITGDITLYSANGATITRSSAEPFRIAKVDVGGRLVLDNITISGGTICNLGVLDMRDTTAVEECGE